MPALPPAGVRPRLARPLSPGAWLPLAAAVRLAAIAFALAACRRPRLSRGAAFGGSAVASLLTGGIGIFGLGAGAAVRGPFIGHQASGLTLGYAVDGLSGWFLVVLAILGVAVAVYSLAYFAHGSSPGRTAFVGVAFNVLLGSVEMVFLADGAIGFLFAWELMTLATVALVATEHEHAQARRAAFLYLAMSHVGTGCLVAAFFILASGGHSLAFTGLLGAHAAAAPARDALFLLFLAGFGVKAGIDPPAHLAARGAPGGAEHDLRAHVRRADQDRDLRDLPRVRRRPGRAAAGLGRTRARPRHRLGGAGRALRADGARPQAPARLSQHREHRHHPASAPGSGCSRCRRDGPGSRCWPSRRSLLPHPQPRPLQGAALPRRRRRRRGHRHPPDGGDGRPGQPDAVDRRVLPPRRRGHLRPAPSSTASSASGSCSSRSCSASAPRPTPSSG